VKYGITFVRRRVREIWQWVSWKSWFTVHKTRIYIVKRWHELWPTACKILSTFCAEAAVLITVFPPLEFLIARRSSQSLNGAAPPIGMNAVIRWSAILCIAFLITSVMFADIAASRDRDEEG
jgi:hypothetical protein